jgi:hypothetical protein
MSGIIKKTIGWILLINIFPIIGGLLTINGKFCYHGVCENVTPFLGGYVRIGVIIIAFAVIAVLFNLVFKYLIFQEK